MSKKLTKTKYQWMVANSWNRLHYVSDITDWDEEFFELNDKQFETSNPHRWKTVCGLQVKLTAPGFISRLGLERCKNCCKLLGITAGNGCPANDKTCRIILGD